MPAVSKRRRAQKRRWENVKSEQEAERTQKQEIEALLQELVSKAEIPQEDNLPQQYAVSEDGTLQQDTLLEGVVSSTELDRHKELPTDISGNRVVNLQFTVSEVCNMQWEHSHTCRGLLKPVKENRKGFSSDVKYQCSSCDYTPTRSTHPNSSINKGAVLGALAVGGAFCTLNQIFSVMDVPVFSDKFYRKWENAILGKSKEILAQSMLEAASEEHKLALQKNQIDSHGAVWIRVYVDGGWSKRSYGHGFNAKSGLAVVIGCATGKLLYLGVRNSYCSVCSVAAHAKRPPVEHQCYKNWSGPSGGMEASILVEAFNHSLPTYGLKYKEFVGDGDAHVYAKIQNECSYGTEVVKIECKNHAVKNYGKALRALTLKTSVITAAARKFLTVPKVNYLQKVAQKALERNAHGDVEELKKELHNGPRHVFGCHQHCQQSFCLKTAVVDPSWSAIEASGLLVHVDVCVERLIRKGHQLIDNVTTNKAESYMSLMCKFNSGKRLNYTSRGSYEGRAYIAGLAYNHNMSWVEKVWKHIDSSPPGFYLHQYRTRALQKLKLKREAASSAALRQKKMRRNENNDEADTDNKCNLYKNYTKF